MIHSGLGLEVSVLLAKIEGMSNASELRGLLANMLEMYGLQSVAYLGTDITARPEEGPFLAVTYTPEWIEHYKTARFVEVDPALQVGLRRMLPVDWSEFDRTSQKVRRLFGEASEFGLGRRGLSFPVHGRYGDRALFSVTSDAVDRDWQLLRPIYMRDFHMLALHMHQAVLRLAGGQPIEHTSLSPRERECLLWIAEGKTYWETAMILGLSEHTVRFYLESARHKLRANNTTHAVSKATKAGLLSRIP